MSDDIRLILMDRLIRLDTELRAAGKLRASDNPPFLPVQPDEITQLSATAGVIASAFYGIPLRVVT